MKFRCLAALMLAAVIGALYLVFALQSEASATTTSSGAAAEANSPYSIRTR